VGESAPEPGKDATPNAVLDFRLAGLEESILRCEADLGEQHDLVVSSWEDARTKAEWWKRWEGYKPKSPWVQAQRSFPAADRWGSDLLSGKPDWGNTLDARYRVRLLDPTDQPANAATAGSRTK